MFALPPYFRCEIHTLPCLKINRQPSKTMFFAKDCLFAGMYACKIICILHTVYFIRYIYDDIYFYPHIPYTHMNMIICIYVFIIQPVYLLSIQDDA